MLTVGEQEPSILRGTDLWKKRQFSIIIIEIYFFNSFFAKSTRKSMSWISSGQRNFCQPCMQAIRYLKGSHLYSITTHVFCRECEPFDLLKLATGSLVDIFENNVSDDGKSVIVNTFDVVFIY